MAKFTVYLTTDLVNSRVEKTFEIPDWEFEGRTEAERTQLIDEWARDEVLDLYDWGWESEG